jgi:histidine triad (HIT) family protein
MTAARKGTETGLQPGKLFTFLTQPDRMAAPCIFCQVASKAIDSLIVYEDEYTLAFLDHRPLFPGHCLLIPKAHHETLPDLPPALIEPLFLAAQRLARAVETGMRAEGSFVAMNNRVSQSVPHLHIHIVPRRKKDGLKGFFWPRNRYESQEAATAAQQNIISALNSVAST